MRRQVVLVLGVKKEQEGEVTHFIKMLPQCKVESGGINKKSKTKLTILTRREEGEKIDVDLWFLLIQFR